MTDKILKITTEEQVEANRVNIDNLIVNTNQNTTDVNDHETRLDILEENTGIGSLPIGDAEDLLTDAKDSVVNAINEVQTEVQAEATRNDQQDIAIQNLASDIVATANDDAEVNPGTAVIASTPTYINDAVVIKPFDNPDVADIVEQLTFTEFQIKGEATVDFIYEFSAEQNIGTNPTFTVEVIDTATNAVIKTSTPFQLDFSGSTSINSGSRTLVVKANAQNLALRVLTNDTNTFNVVSSNIQIKVFGAKTVEGSGVDTNITSTNNLGGSTNVYGDINFLNTNKANQTDLDALEAEVDAIVIPDTSVLESRVEANEDNILNLQADKLDIERDFSSSTSGISGTIDNSNAQASGSSYTETYLGQMKSLTGAAGTTEANIGLRVGTDGKVNAVARYKDSSGSLVPVDTTLSFGLTTKQYVDGMLDTLMPVGTIQLGVTAPAFGTWADLGVLAAGQAIIGSRPDGDGNNTVADGTSYSGAVKSHNHIWSTGYGFGDGGGTARKFINHLTTYNSDDTETSITDSSEDTAKNVYTKKTGGSNNIAYGKQVGYDIHVWKRTA